MEKMQYISPLIEVMSMNTVVMQAFGPASMPDDSFNSSNPAPKRATEAF
jgi:hypothetical protein